MDPNLFTTNETVAFTAIAVVLAVLAAAARYSWRVAAGAMAAEGASRRFHDVTRRLGIDLQGVEDERTLRAAAISVRRCLACRHQAACDAWLADSRNRGAPPNCPNQAFLREQARR